MMVFFSDINKKSCFRADGKVPVLTLKQLLCISLPMANSDCVSALCHVPQALVRARTLRQLLDSM